MKMILRSLFSSAIVASSLVAVMAQAPAGQGGRAWRRTWRSAPPGALGHVDRLAGWR